MLGIVVRICIDIHNLAITLSLFLTYSIFEEFLCVVSKRFSLLCMKPHDHKNKGHQAKPVDTFCGVHIENLFFWKCTKTKLK
jgi:hypothetical protein